MFYCFLYMCEGPNGKRKTKEDNENPQTKFPGKAFINQIMDVDGVTDEELISQAVTLLVAALDTTKIENTAVLLMLALHPHIQNEVSKLNENESFFLTST